MMAGPPRARSTWWRGGRGEWFVVLQVVLLLVIALGPRELPGQASRAVPVVARVVGVVVMAGGAALLIWSAVKLGGALTPLPYPRPGGRFVDGGPFAHVRHPIYSAALLVALGWSAYTLGTVTFACTLLLFGVLDRKARREERWLAAKFPEYPAYARRVRKFVPHLY